MDLLLDGNYYKYGLRKAPEIEALILNRICKIILFSLFMCIMR